MESSVLLKGFPTVNSASGTFLTPPPRLGGRPVLVQASHRGEVGPGRKD